MLKTFSATDLWGPSFTRLTPGMWKTDKLPFLRMFLCRVLDTFVED